MNEKCVSFDIKDFLVEAGSVANFGTGFGYFLFRSILVVLGIVSDSQAQTSRANTGDASNSDKEAVTEKSKEESSSAC